MTPLALKDAGHGTSWLPVSGFQKLDATKPVTNRHLAEAYNQLHDCVHDVGRRVDAAAAAAAAATKSSQENAVSLARVEGALGVRLKSPDDGAKVEPVKRKLAGVSQLTAILALIAAAVGAAGAYKYLFPALEAGAMALHHALMAG